MFMRSYLFLFLCSLVLLGCKDTLTIDCDKVDKLSDPVPTLRFRILSDANNEDLIANGTLSFDSLQVTQPCNINNTLKKVLLSYNNGYQFYFSDIRQPIVGENTECFDLYLKWNSTTTDKISFRIRAEHTPCQTLYYVDRVLYNDKQIVEENGSYILRR